MRTRFKNTSPPSALHWLRGLTIKLDRPQLSKADIAKLEAAMRNNKASEYNSAPPVNGAG